MFLEYFVADSATYLFEISTEQAQVHKIEIPKSTLNHRANLLRTALSDYQSIQDNPSQAWEAYSQSAYWFYQNLLQISLDGKLLTNLILVPDGKLGHLPFGAFLTQPATTNPGDYADLAYLIKDYTISYNYSATLWKQNQSSDRKTNNHQILGCAASYHLKKDSSLQKLRSGRDYLLRQHLQPLPAAEAEVRALSKTFNGKFLFGKQTNEAFFKQNAEDYGIIHLAMHGLLHKRLPILSSLAFTENNDSTEDNFLQAHEIAHLQLNADLVVLSACETGYGKFEQGEGVMSLARSFMYAGVPSLVVSLWQVNDQSTSQIMQNFYTEMSNGSPKDLALRKAKMDYIQSSKGTGAHPAFWSPFIQLGDNRAIELSPKSSGWLWWGLGGLGLLLVGGGIAMRRKKM